MASCIAYWWYGEEAMKLFDLALKLHQTNYKEYQAKIFGGANMVRETTGFKDPLIGEKMRIKQCNY
jgi:chemotaxis receptor (MCP) glutamine deamidase CheD